MDKQFIHELIICILIISIVIFQIIVLGDIIQKVKSFIIILSQTERFKTHKVYIPVEEIDSIDSQHIIDNLSHYLKKPLNTKVDELISTYSIKSPSKDDAKVIKEKE